MKRLTSEHARVGFIRQMVTTDMKFARRAVVALHLKTTERDPEEPVWNNGFTSRDHDALTLIAEEALNNTRMRQAQFDVLKQKLPKYAGQLSNLISLSKWQDQ